MKQTGTISCLVEYGLRFLGLWPGLPYATVNWSLYILSLLITQYFFYSYAFVHFDAHHISPLIDCLSIALAYTLVTLKLVNLWVNRRALRELVDAIDEDWKEASVVASNKSVMMQNADFARRCSNLLMGYNAVAALLYVIGGVSPIFELTVLAQGLHQVTVATLVAMLNGLILTLILHVSGQIDIVCENVRELTPKSFESLSTIRKLIYQHQKIIDFSNYINDLFSFIALLEFLWNTMVICFIGFAIVASLGTEDALTMMTKSITYYIAITVEAFVFCCGGEYLSAKSNSIGDAVYDSLWYNLKPRDCQVLLFIIARSQKHLTITAGGLMDLSLEAFTSIMKASASYVSVLHAMY